MTTIAYKDGVVAYDSRSTKGGTIVTDEKEKMRLHEGVRFWLCGDCGAIDEFVRQWLDEGQVVSGSCEGLVLDKDGTLYMSGTDAGFIWRTVHDSEVYFAWGSGGDHALTALDCGLSPSDAVKMAVKRDSCTGGEIKEWNIGDL